MNNEGDIQNVNTPLLQVRDLKKYFPVTGGLLHAVDGVSFDIAAGETLGIVGESGCGKSTLGRVVLRLIEPTGGEILYHGEDIMSVKRRSMRKMRTDMQIIFQDPNSSLNPRLPLWELIAEPMFVNKVYKTKKETLQRVREIMSKVGLAERLENVYPFELDGGRRQRIGIARALAVNPRFIVCDEPVSALDVSIQAQILNLLMDLQEEEKITYMFITHDLSVVKHISDNIAVMYLGEIVELASAKDIFRTPLHPYTRALLDAIPVPDISSIDREINIIHGEISSPVNPKPICRFAPRCPEATEECTSGQSPKLHQVEPGHAVACFHASG